MGEQTGIAWTDHTFNPWWGCTKVSPGCKNCYADTLTVYEWFDVVKEASGREAGPFPILSVWRDLEMLPDGYVALGLGPALDNLEREP